MERAIITISDNDVVNIPSGNIWMSEMELVELFGVIAPTLRVAIKAIYKSNSMCESDTLRYIQFYNGYYGNVYSLEMIVALSFRFNTYEAEKVRREILKSLCECKEDNTSVLIAFYKIQSTYHLN